MPENQLTNGVKVAERAPASLHPIPVNDPLTLKPNDITVSALPDESTHFMLGTNDVTVEKRDETFWIVVDGSSIPLRQEPTLMGETEIVTPNGTVIRNTNTHGAWNLSIALRNGEPTFVVQNVSREDALVQEAPQEVTPQAPQERNVGNPDSSDRNADEANQYIHPPDSPQPSRDSSESQPPTQETEFSDPGEFVTFVATGGMEVAVGIDLSEPRRILGKDTEKPSLLLIKSAQRTLSEETRAAMEDSASPIQTLKDLHESQGVSGIAAEVVTKDDGLQYLQLAKLGIDKPYVILIQEPTPNDNDKYHIRAHLLPSHDVTQAELQILPGQRIAIIDEVIYGDPRSAKPLVSDTGTLQVPPVEKYIARGETVRSFLSDLSYQLNWQGRQIIAAGFEVPQDKNADMMRMFGGGPAQGHQLSMREDANFSRVDIEERTYDAVYDNTSGGEIERYHVAKAALIQSHVDLVSLQGPGIFLGYRGDGKRPNQFPIVIDMQHDGYLQENAYNLRAALNRLRNTSTFKTSSLEHQTRIMLDLVSQFSLAGTQRDTSTNAQTVRRFERRYLQRHPGVTAIPVGRYEAVVCLQLAAKAGALAAEMVRSGMFGNRKVEVRLRRSTYQQTLFQEGGGHAFAVAFVYDDAGRTTAWIIDPMNRFVGTLDDAKQLRSTELQGYYEAIKDELQILG